jgi:hypothetical protein
MSLSNVTSNGSLKIEFEDQSTAQYFITKVAYAYIIPTISSISLLLNTVCLIVFIHGKELKGNLYVYFKAKTMAEMLLAFLGLLEIFNYCDKCSTTSLFAHIYLAYLVRGVHDIACTFVGFMEISVVYDRYITIKTKSKINLKLSSWPLIFSSLAISLVINVPCLLKTRVVLIENTTDQYTSMFTEFGESGSYGHYWLANIIHVSCVYCVLLPIFSVALIIEFKKFMKRKSSLISNDANSSNAANEFDAKKNLTSLVLAMSVVFLISRIFLIFTVSYYVYDSFSIPSVELKLYLNFFAYDLNYLITSGLNLFFYINFNRLFKKCLFDLLKNILPNLFFLCRAIRQ